ncbi:MAG: isoleucine--tRNA ligase [Gammaproteobacteria bacterium]|nr:isoleucine--tRNA ligase [Gammaproteobacteria bacterium]
MTEYKDTLNLPKTDFPMKANLAQREPELLARWQKMDLYQRLQDLGKDLPKFILHDGPPYANGEIHLGHVVNKVLKDLITKSKRLSGFDAPYVPGWDCHGLPIELNVERKLGKAGLHISAKDFRTACRRYAKEQVEIQSQAFQRLGILGEWQNPYLTMDPSYEAGVIRVLGKIAERGHIDRRYKPVHWCSECRSALAEAEVEYIDRESPAIDVLFKVIDPAAMLARCEAVGQAHIAHQVDVVIWTTTPWTLPANQAVAVHPDLDYVIFSCYIKQRFCTLMIGEDLLHSFIQRVDANDIQTIARVKGHKLELLTLQHPFCHRHVPLVLSKHVTTDVGTGCVHIAPAHGQDDYEVGLKYNLPVDHEVMADGHFEPEASIVGGMYVFDANRAILEILAIQDDLLHSGRLTHSYPHCWRHKKPLIFRGTPQWFVSMEQEHLRQATLAAIKKISWIPEWGQARITDMVTKRPDWCISRQRNWGVPIPFFIHKDTNALHPKSNELLEKVAELVAERGVDAWFDLDPHTLLGSSAVDYDKLSDTLDVWFDSGSSFACVLQQRPELRFPADVYVEGSDQYRGWFHTSLLAAIAATGQAPYKQVLTHGFTVDAQGRKMSKSLGNVISPDKIMKTLGADILRLWVASTDYRGEITVSDEIFNRTADIYRRIRNTARFLLSNLNDFNPATDLVDSDKLLSLDAWAIDKALHLQQELIHAYDDYQFHTVCQKIHHFCSVDMGSFYLDIVKDRQYTTKENSVARRSAQTAMYHILEALVRWLAPILSYTAEEIWQYIPHQQSESIFFETWYTGLYPAHDADVMGQAYWHEIIRIRDAVNKQIEVARNAQRVGSGLEANVTLYCSSALFDLLSKLGDELRFVLITSTVKLVARDTPPKTASATGINGLSIIIKASSSPKCARCWHRLESVGQDKSHPELCSRCIDNVDGQGETRCFA